MWRAREVDKGGVNGKTQKNDKMEPYSESWVNLPATKDEQAWGHFIEASVVLKTNKSKGCPREFPVRPQPTTLVLSPDELVTKTTASHSLGVVQELACESGH